MNPCYSLSYASWLALEWLQAEDSCIPNRYTWGNPAVLAAAAAAEAANANAEADLHCLPAPGVDSSRRVADDN